MYKRNVEIRHIFICIVIVSIIAAMPMLFAKIRTKTDKNKITLPSIDDVPEEYWVKLAEKKIFFGHQSVGYNIIEGIQDIINKRSYVRLNIVETRDLVEFNHPIFAHSRVGSNTNPTSKINDFKTIMDAGVGNKVDIAFFKFCYVDITRDSKPLEIHMNYRNTIEDLNIRYPQTSFLHVTVPLCSAPSGAKKTSKESVKLLLGRPGILNDNLKRQNYNTLLNDTYSKRSHIFDLAQAESVNRDGFKCFVAKGIEKVFVMAPEYTTDGGHLNEEGRRRVAGQLLITLAEMANKSQ